MYAIFWMVKKFEYKLGGKKFKIETDHKVLVKFRNKPGFENNRDNRWIEKMQQFDFTIEYRNRERYDSNEYVKLSLYTERERKEKDDPKQ